MSVLASKLSKLEALAGIGLSPMEQLNRLADSQSSETLLAALALVRARIKGTEPPPEATEDVVALVDRLMNLMAAAN